LPDNSLSLEAEVLSASNLTTRVVFKVI